jgi:hypothetical protein
MSGEVRNVLDVHAINRLLSSRQGPVARDLLRRGYRVTAVAKRLCPVDHGRLRASITPVLVSRDGMFIVEVGTNVKYARWVHDGTGIYGPRQARIYPRTAKVMVFSPRTSAGQFIPRKKRAVVFAKSTKGMKGRPFLKDALWAAHG